MTQEQINKILQELRADPLGPSGRAGITEAYHVDRRAATRERGEGDVAAAFSCKTKSGGDVTVQILDEGRGFEPQQLRYGCRAVTKSGRLLVTGNGGATPMEALESVHWGQLEGELAREAPEGLS